MNKRTSRWRRQTQRARVGALIIATTLASVLAQPAPASAEALPVPTGTNECPHLTDSITRLYSAYFLRAPDAAGFDFWVETFSSGEMGLQAMSEFFSSSSEFQTLYAELSNTEFVDLVYRNVLGRAPESEGRAFWIAQLENGTMSRGTVMISFSESPEFVARTATAVPLAGYFNWYPEGTGFNCGTGIVELELFPGDGFIDMLAVHDATISSQPGSIEIQDLRGGAVFPADSHIVPNGFVALTQYEAALLGDGIQAVTSRQLSVYLVAYPDGFPPFADRSGWRIDDGRQPTTTDFANLGS